MQLIDFAVRSLSICGKRNFSMLPRGSMLRQLAGVVFVLLFAATSVHAEKPNVILFLADDLGWTGLSSFGSDLYETPNLDRLCDNGVKFTNAYAACTVCSPTRASLLTGKYPARLRCTDFIAGQNRPFAKLKIPDWNKRLDSKELTLAEVFKQNGYRTAHVGKWHLDSRNPGIEGTDPVSQGFDLTYQKPKGSRGNFVPVKKGVQNEKVFVTDYLTDKALEFLQDSNGNESDESPFFLYFAYHVPHTPVVGRTDLVREFSSKTRANAKHRNPDFAAMVSSMDTSVGRVLERVRNLGIDENTVVIFISDNGGLTERYGKVEDFTDNSPLRRGKGSAYEGGVRVPAIISWPGVTKSGTTCDVPVMTIDVFPTLCAVLGHEVADEVDGRNLTNLLGTPEGELDRDLYWHYPHYHAGGDSPYSAIRSGNWRLIEFHEDKKLELYDLHQDLGEQKNLVSSHPEKAKELHDALIRWRDSVDAQMPTPNPNFDPVRAAQVRKNK